jgi:mannose-6-phosphate isomerase-like protein (cupin superfamily)
MKITNYFEIDGMEFPAGRKTRVIIGPNGAIEAEHFVQGIVSIYPGGAVPPHEHDEEEVYLILSGSGEMTVGEETRSVKKGDAVYITPSFKHSLKNTGKDDMEMLFTYAPKKIAEHWNQEKQGSLK